MRSVVFFVFLVASILANVGCGGDGSGGGGSGPSTAFSFDAENAEEAAGASAVATAFATQFGTLVSGLLSELSSGAAAASVGVQPKINVPISAICQTGGSALLDWQASGPNLSAGDVLTLTLSDCAGSPVSAMAANGTISLDIISASGGIPVIGGIILATATLDIDIDPDTTITGSFELDANLPSLALANLTFGAKQDSDQIKFTVGTGLLRLQSELACFEIYQRVAIGNPGIEFFRPLGVMKLENQVFTLNSYTETPDNILFDFAGFDATPRSGSLTLDSGDLSGGVCSAFSGNPTANQSFVTATFTGGGCVSLAGTDTAGAPFNIVRTWDSLLDVGRMGGSGDACGAGGSGGSGATTPAMEPPVSCPEGNDVVTIADAYVRGNGSDGDYSETPYGNASNLLIKSVPDLSFTRKIYIAFDLSAFSETFTKASLVLTLERHVENTTDPSLSGPQPVDVYGISDDMDWDPAVIPEDAITWDNAPRNDKAAPNRFEDSPGVPLLIPGYDFDLGGDGVIDPPEVTKYALDITEYVTDRLANDADKKVTILMAIPTGTNVDGSAFKSRNIPDGEMCDRPFLHFE